MIYMERVSVQAKRNGESTNSLMQHTNVEPNELKEFGF